MCLLPATEAGAEVRLAPSTDGYLGAWLVAGPLPASRAAALDAAAVAPRHGVIDGASGVVFRLREVADGALDLRKVLAVDRQPGRVALVAGTLELTQDLHGWLLVGADGRLSCYVNGTRVLARPAPQLRGQGWDFIPLSLGKGRHRLLFRLEQAREHWAFSARILERQRFLAPRGVSLLLEGLTAADAERLAVSLQTRSFSSGLSELGYRPAVTIEYRRGMPLQVPLTTRVRATRAASGETLFDVAAGALQATERGATRFEVTLPPVPASALSPKSVEAVRLDLQTGPVRASRTWFASGKAPALVARAQALLKRRAPATDARQGVLLATLEHRLERLQRIGIGPRASARSVERALTRLDDWATHLETDRDPLLDAGLLALARRSELDGSLQRFLLHVPHGIARESARRYPLVTVLHGYGGSPGGVLSAFFDSRPQAPSVRHQSFVLAPHAHGNAFYRGPGEHEVLRQLAWVRDHFPIDPDRVTITGVSMGGTGAAELGLRHADQFAAASPLCGYHSYFVRRDIAGKPLRDWEREQMTHYSPASFAENGRHLPLYVAHGLKDFPLENARVLIGRYRSLGQRISEDWPDVGHAVWEEYWTGARMWPVLASQKRNPAPAQVTLKTDSLRNAQLYWVRLHAFDTGARLAQIAARVVAGTSDVAVQTSGVSAFELSPPDTLLRSNETRQLTIDGHSVVYPAGEALRAQRSGTTWVKGVPPTPATHKRAGLEGPLRDAFLEPLVFVYGTLDPATWRANRELAETLARTRFGPGVTYRVLADRELSPSIEREHGLFLVGNQRDHALLNALGPALPITADDRALRIGSRRHAAPEVGALFIHPNPRANGRYLVVLTAPSVPGAFRALSLPALLPDFVVYDARVAPATRQQVLGPAAVIEAGYFNADWSVPAPSPSSGPAPLPPAAAASAPTAPSEPRAADGQRASLVARGPAAPQAPDASSALPARRGPAAPQERDASNAPPAARGPASPPLPSPPAAGAAGAPSRSGVPERPAPDAGPRTPASDP